MDGRSRVALPAGGSLDVGRCPSDRGFRTRGSRGTWNDRMNSKRWCRPGLLLPRPATRRWLGHGCPGIGTRLIGSDPSEVFQGGAAGSRVPDRRSAGRRGARHFHYLLTRRRFARAGGLGDDSCHDRHAGRSCGLSPLERRVPSGRRGLEVRPDPRLDCGSQRPDRLDLPQLSRWDRGVNHAAEKAEHPRPLG